MNQIINVKTHTKIFPGVDLKENNPLLLIGIASDINAVILNGDMLKIITAYNIKKNSRRPPRKSPALKRY